MKLNFKQFVFVREYLGISQTELASKIEGLSQSNLSKFEKGLLIPSDEVLDRVISFFGFPKGFYNQCIINLSENTHFRKRTTISKKQRLEIEYSFRIIGYIVDQMAEALEWPEFSLTPINLEDGYTTQSVARHTRKSLGIEPGDPIRNINTRLEKNGIIIVELDTIEKFDGVSFITDGGTPIIVMNQNFSNDRKRFTLAHELGHIIMHCAGNFPISDIRDKEDEANKFASELLMPEDYIKDSLRNLRLSELSSLKQYWLTSMSSLMLRAKDLGCIDKNKYQYYNIEFSRKGWRKNEPVNVDIDSPKLFLMGYKMHKEELDYSVEELADAFNLRVQEIERYCKPKRTQGKLRVLYPQ